jgi:hypothetical protein
LSVLLFNPGRHKLAHQIRVTATHLPTGQDRVIPFIPLPLAIASSHLGAAGPQPGFEMHEPLAGAHAFGTRFFEKSTELLHSLEALHLHALHTIRHLFNWYYMLIREAI